MILIGIIMTSMLVPCQQVVQTLSYQQPSTSKPVSHSVHELPELIKANLISDVQNHTTISNNAAVPHQGGSERTRIKVDNTPYLMAVDPQKNLVYVTYTTSSDFVSVINGSTSKRVADIPLYSCGPPIVGAFCVGQQHDIAVNPAAQKVYVTNPVEQSVSVIDTSENKVVHQIPVPGALAIAVNGIRNMIYVATGDNNTVSVINGSTNKVVDNIRITNPTTVAVNPETNMVFVANSDSNIVSLINGSTNKVVANLIVGDNPMGIAVNAKTNKIYIGIGYGNRIAVLDGTMKSFISSVSAGNVSHRYSGTEVPNLAVDPDTNMIYITNKDWSSVSAIDGSTNKIVATIKVESDPETVVVNSKTHLVFVLHVKDDTVGVIDTSMNPLSTGSNAGGGIIVGSGPTNNGWPLTTIAVNSDTNRVYVDNSDGNTVSVIDGSKDKVTSNIQVGNGSGSIAVSKDKNLLYGISSYGVHNSILYVLNGSNNKVTPNAVLGNGNWTSLTIDPSTNLAYVANTVNNTVAVIDTVSKKVISIIRDANANIPMGIAADSSTGNIYVLNQINAVSVYDSSHNLITNVSLDTPPYQSTIPDGIAINRVTNLVYVSNPLNNSVSVIDPYTYKEVARIHVGDNPVGITVNPITNEVYVANQRSNVVSVINGSDNQVTVEIPVGNSPSAVAVNEVTNKIYVASFDSNIVSLIDGSINKVAAGLTFDVKPLNTGQIKCNGRGITTNQYVLVEFGSQCEAEANNGFQFNSWSENLGHNSSKTITRSALSNSPFDVLFGSQNDKAAAFKVNSQYGNFTADFKPLPPPIPPEYLLTLFGIMLGTFTPSIFRWVNGWRQRKNLGKWLDRIASDHDKQLDPITLEDQVMRLYTKGKINDSHYTLLKEKISECYPDTKKH